MSKIPENHNMEPALEMLDKGISEFLSVATILIKDKDQGYGDAFKGRLNEMRKLLLDVQVKLGDL